MRNLNKVFYTGEEQWKSNLSLEDMYAGGDILGSLIPYTIRYRMNLVSAYEVENTDRFHSELKMLFDILKHTESGEDLAQYVTAHDEYKCIDELTYLTLSLFLDISDSISVGKNHNEEDCNMCKAVRELYESGYNSGIESGIQQGICALIEAFNEQGLSDDIICDKLVKYYELSQEKAYEWISKMI